MGDVISFPDRQRGLPDDDSSVDQIREWAKQLISTEAGGPDSVMSLVQGLLGAGPFGGFDSRGLGRRPRPKLLRKRSKRVTYVVRLDLDGAKPPIWRRLRLASDLTLDEVHEIVQVAMGWTGTHLHDFKMGPDLKDFQMMPFLTAYDIDVEGETQGIPEANVRLDQVLAEPGHRLFYEYDFGDGWDHTLKLEKVEPWAKDAPDAACVAGRRACPPEDIGGIHGYEQFLDALARRGDPDLTEWQVQLLDAMPDDFDPAFFDADDVNEALTQPDLGLDEWRPEVTTLLLNAMGTSPQLSALVEAALADPPPSLTPEQFERATERYRRLLAAVGDGLPLQDPYFLAQDVAEGLVADLQLGDDPTHRVSADNPVYVAGAVLDTAKDLGLLRKAKRQYLVTTAGRKLQSDPAGLFAHVVGRLPSGSEFETDAGLICLLFAATGRDWDDARPEAGEMLAMIGWDAADMELALARGSVRTNHLLKDLVGSDGDPEWRGLIARALLARLA